MKFNIYQFHYLLSLPCPTVRLCLQRTTSCKSAAKVSGALALISNCQITFAWVISRRNTVPPPSSLLPCSPHHAAPLLERTPLPRIWQPGRMQLHRWLWWAEHLLFFSFLSFFLFLSLHRKRRYLSDARPPSAVQQIRRGMPLTHSYTHFRHGERGKQLAARCAAQSSCNVRLSL